MGFMEIRAFACIMMLILARPTSGPVPLTVQFTDSSTGTIKAWSWEYRRNGGPWIRFATVQNPFFTFRTAGTYDIRLIVTGPWGMDGKVKPRYITVLEPARGPIAMFTQNRYAGKVPSPFASPTGHCTVLTHTSGGSGMAAHPRTGTLLIPGPCPGYTWSGSGFRIAPEVTRQ